MGIKIVHNCVPTYERVSGTNYTRKPRAAHTAPRVVKRQPNTVHKGHLVKASPNGKANLN